MWGMGRVIAVANQKGGVAKTTTVASLGVALSEMGRRVLLVDLDPQACLTFSLGLDPESIDLSVHDVLLGRVSAAVAIVATEDGPDLLPSTIDLAGAEAMLLPRTGREYVLRTALEEIAGSYDDILLDCAPSLGVLTINALTAADEVLIPLQCETLSHRGVGQLLDTVQDVQRLTNRGLRVRGVLPTLYDGRTNHAKMVIADVATRYGLPVLEPPIPKSVRFAEAPAAGHSVLVTARRAAGADAYRLHAKALLKPIPKTKSAPKTVAAKAPAPKDAVAPPASPEASAPAQPERAPRRRVSA
jgi:chromosome partitioning protein